MIPLSQILRTLQQACEQAGIKHDLSMSYAWQLLEKVTGLSKTNLLAQHTYELSPSQTTWVDQALGRLRQHEPLAYILGDVVFLDFTLMVRPPILIPRPETEAWVAKLIEYCHTQNFQPKAILDVGTGTGCIALALAQAFPHAHVIAVDKDERAVQLARENAQHNNIHTVDFVHSDVCRGISPAITYDLIVSNPPYVRESDWELLDESVTQWESKDAIIAPEEGLDLIRQIIICASQRKAHVLALEIDVHQAKTVQRLMHSAGFSRTIIGKDATGRDRYVWGVR